MAGGKCDPCRKDSLTLWSEIGKDAGQPGAAVAVWHSTNAFGSLCTNVGVYLDSP